MAQPMLCGRCGQVHFGPCVDVNARRGVSANKPSVNANSFVQVKDDVDAALKPLRDQIAKLEAELAHWKAAHSMVSKLLSETEAKLQKLDRKDYMRDYMRKRRACSTP